MANDNLNIGVSDGILDLVMVKSVKVPNLTFLIKLHKTGEEVGQIRYYDAKEDTKYVGNVSYVIYEKYRGQNYALEALWILKEVLLEKEISKMLLNVFPESEASKKTAEQFGAVYKGDVFIPSDHELYEMSVTHKMLVYELKLEDK